MDLKLSLEGWLGSKCHSLLDMLKIQCRILNDTTLVSTIWLLVVNHMKERLTAHNLRNLTSL